MKIDAIFHADTQSNLFRTPETVGVFYGTSPPLKSLGFPARLKVRHASPARATSSGQPTLRASDHPPYGLLLPPTRPAIREMRRHLRVSELPARHERMVGTFILNSVCKSTFPMDEVGHCTNGPNTSRSSTLLSGM